MSHSEGERFECDFNGCKKSSKNKIHFGKKMVFVCPHCNRKTNYKNNLKTYLLIHSVERKFNCDYEECKKVYEREYYLNKHKKIIYTKKALNAIVVNAICN